MCQPTMFNLPTTTIGEEIGQQGNKISLGPILKIEGKKETQLEMKANQFLRSASGQDMRHTNAGLDTRRKFCPLR